MLFICRIFDSQKYQDEELTIFNSSLIEDTVTRGKSYLSGKYTGSYILIHPMYQRGKHFKVLPINGILLVALKRI